MKRKDKIRFVMITIIVIILLFAFAVTKGMSKKNIKTNDKLPVSVETHEVQIGEISEHESYTGTLEGKEQADIISQTSGVVEKILFTPGQNCKAGQELCIIENSQQKAGVEQASAQVIAAESNYEKAQKDYARMEQLYKDKVSTKDNLELSQLNVKSAYAQLKGAQAGLMMAEKMYSDTRIKSSIEGKIATKLVNLGQTIAPGMPVARIVDDSEFKLKILVSESRISSIKKNQSVKITIDALPSLQIDGHIQSVGLAFEGEGKSYPVEITIPHKTHEDIKSGMFTRCDIKTGSNAQALLIPESALITENNEYFVYVADGNKVQKTKVEIGLRDPEHVEIINGLQKGMMVVTTGKEMLNEDSLISTGDIKNEIN